MSDWYGRQFGDREHLALGLSFGRTPHPGDQPALDATWGGLSLWVRGRCLTRNVSDDSGVSDEVRWSLLSVLDWLAHVGVRLINEEPFPLGSASERVRDGCDWINETEVPMLTLSEAEEDSWFATRSEWRNHHALRRAAVDVALPNVVLRRLGDALEVSWDNETWGSSRPDISFVERRGTERVSARAASDALTEALRDVSSILLAKTDEPELKQLAARIASSIPNAEDWKWLVHQQTAAVIKGELGALHQRLIRNADPRGRGFFIPHTLETMALRQVRLGSAAEVEAFLRASTPTLDLKIGASLQQLIKPEAAPAVEGWRVGYDRALEIRDVLGWGDDPAPDLREWLSRENVGISMPRLSSSIDVISNRTQDGRALAVINPQGGSPLRRETGLASALGHIIMDDAGVWVEGTWEHWPTAARARAFGVMLLLPDGGVRKLLAGRDHIDASDVHRVMDHFKTGPHATTYHLKNRGFIANEERRVEILRQL